MPAMSKNDPRYYVKQMSLPITHQKGIKIQARSDLVYNPTDPTRVEVRKENYDRRFKQMREQGFNAANYKPYQGIGDPFYLDKKKLILNALGQWNPIDNSDSSSTDDDEDKEERKKTQQQPQQKPFTTTNFFVRRTTKDLNTLNKETTHGREMIRNVRLGHGLFYMLRRMRQQKVMAEQRELKKRQEQQRSEWQPPKYDSSSEDLESEADDSDVELELKQYLSDDGCEKETEKAPASPEMTISVACENPAETPLPLESINKASRVAFLGIENASTSERPRSIRSGKTSSRPGSRRKVLPPRPFTPNHSNINTDIDYNLDKEGLFRQLCALYWLLEAMNVENPNTMAPISTCWSMREVGGSKGKDRKQEKEKLDVNWNKFVTKQNALKDEKHSKKMVAKLTANRTFFTAIKKFRRTISVNVAGGKRASRHSKSYRRYGGYQPQVYRHRGSSVVSTARSETPPGSVSHLDSSQGPSIAPPNIKVDSVIPEGGQGDLGYNDMDDDEDNIYTKGLFRFLDEYYDSLRKKESGEASEDKQSSAEVASSHSARSDKRGRDRYSSTGVQPQQHQPQSDVPEYEDLSPQEVTAILENIERSYLDPRLHKLANPTERRTSKNMRADINVRPKSSPAVLDFKSKLPSATRGRLPINMRQQFIEVNQNKALILHDTLEALDRERLRKVQNKFMHLPTEGSSYWKAVRTMRCRSVLEEEHLRESQRKQSLYQQWFTDLDSNIPLHLKQDWYFGKILQKLQKYGLVEANKQSAYKFLMVLSSLRDWEICSPDICSAIEYCRERIVEMSIEEYEDWFHHQFPKVIRPQTAPAAVKCSEKEQHHVQRHKVNGHVPHSAPPGGRKLITS